MNKLLALSALVIVLVGCDAEVIVPVNISQVSNLELNDTVITSQAKITIDGSCKDRETGAESDSLSKANGMMWNLFAREHEFVSCKATSKYAFDSIVTYNIETQLITKQGGMNSSKNKRELGLGLADGKVLLMVSDKLKQRLKARTGELDSVEPTFNVKLVNDTTELVEASSKGVYIYTGKSFTPYQEAGYTIKPKGSFYIRTGSVGADALTTHGYTHFATITK
ncbi:MULTISPECIES: hypothetical protein [Agarivorans]|uniref:DUF7424 family protein n=1 Tax=Agarivorans TaxID=261825 RepID=UPI001C7FE200|nr:MULTISPECIES: hypothetical protein [Agarivorans]UPW18684.1 hypothetical protein M0C34_21120 [Agarivorans sp. TSD2052]